MGPACADEFNNMQKYRRAALQSGIMVSRIQWILDIEEARAPKAAQFFPTVIK